VVCPAWIVKSTEVGFPRELTDKFWDALAVKFQKIEGALQLLLSCEGRTPARVASGLSVRSYDQAQSIRCSVTLLILLCQWFDVVVEIIGFFKNKNDSFLFMTQ
jgi:hypothetical protein